MTVFGMIAMAGVEEMILWWWLWDWDDDNGDDGNDGGNNGGGDADATNTFFGNNIEYFSITPELDYNFSEHIGLSASAGFATSGRNQLASPNFSLGLYYQL